MPPPRPEEGNNRKAENQTAQEQWGCGGGVWEKTNMRLAQSREHLEVFVKEQRPKPQTSCCSTAVTALHCSRAPAALG